MCSEKECLERQASNEVSEFEATLDTFQKPLGQRVIDPSLAVTKYRRSAAGAERQKPRHLNQLLAAWKHLCTRIVLHQHVHPQQIPWSLVNTVNFTDDRVRAIQVDLVVSQQASSRLQLQLVRYHLVSLYLLSNVPQKIFDPKFSCQALMTAIVAYWNETTVFADDDDILCYAILCQVTAKLCGNHSWIKAGEIFEMYRKHSPHFHKTQAHYPKFLRAVQIAAAAHRQEFARILFFLSENSFDLGHLGRICLAPCLNKIRWLSLVHYNKAWMKREKIAPEEIARLLCFSTPEIAIAFCVEAGLPFEDDKLIFKAKPVKELPSYNINRSVDDCFCLKEADDTTGYRVDADNVKVPPHDVLRRLILQ